MTGTMTQWMQVCRQFIDQVKVVYHLFCLSALSFELHSRSNYENKHTFIQTLLQVRYQKKKQYIHIRSNEMPNVYSS